jgi:hypothetical protein
LIRRIFAIIGEHYELINVNLILIIFNAIGRIVPIGKKIHSKSDVAEASEAGSEVGHHSYIFKFASKSEIKI